MALAKEIMGQCMVEAFCSNVSRLSLQPKRWCIKRHGAVTMTYSELKTMLQQEAPFNFIKDDSSKRDLALNPVTLTITATVTIKNSKITYTEKMAMMLPQFDVFNNALRERGIVIQLVSTQVQPGEPRTKCMNNHVIWHLERET
ncbi:uncharacterized protein LOC114916216 isoform X2 [Cajanus cajan]|uniref:uncharacterized protein LOC114916216 isoform X2 n=1 Tax=Cajanus cajan TaxID=3821 RepID=UPI0010FB5A6E|nr:uncharacterized protein LOC114916216 isoform X2 [Cajanus cajan]